jgi:septation ring formation regulator EzrA
MEKRFEQVDKRFEQVDKRFEQMRADTNARFEQVDKRFEQVDKRFEELREDMKSGFEVSRSHTNHWMTFLTIVLLVMGAAMTLATVLAG